jgi:cytoskeletal protein RodZ
MSQVNDALKRAGNADRNRPRQPETQGRLKSSDDSGPSFLRLVLMAVVLLALAFAALFFWRWWLATHQSAHPKKAPVAAGAPRPPPPPGVAETEAPASTDTAASSSSSADSAETAWPTDLKLMGIVFNQRNSIALINGQTLAVGDVIDGIRITKIERDRVSLEWNKQVKVLTLTAK